MSAPQEGAMTDRTRSLAFDIASALILGVLTCVLGLILMFTRGKGIPSFAHEVAEWALTLPMGIWSTVFPPCAMCSGPSSGAVLATLLSDVAIVALSVFVTIRLI